MTFSEKLQKLRKEKHLSQEALAEAIGVSRQSVSKWELGTATPDVDKIILLSDYLQVSTDYLLKDSLTKDPLTESPLTEDSMTKDSITEDSMTKDSGMESASGAEPLPCDAGEPLSAPASVKKKGSVLDSIVFFLWILAILAFLIILVTSKCSIQDLMIVGLTVVLIAAPVCFLVWLVHQAGTHADTHTSRRKK